MKIIVAAEKECVKKKKKNVYISLFNSKWGGFRSEVSLWFLFRVGRHGGNPFTVLFWSKLMSIIVIINFRCSLRIYQINFVIGVCFICFEFYFQLAMKLDVFYLSIFAE